MKSIADNYDDHRGVQGVHPVPEEGDQAGHGANAARAQAEGDHGAHLEVLILNLFLRVDRSTYVISICAGSGRT